jgi:carboxymethylenebutenolidase
LVIQRDMLTPVKVAIQTADGLCPSYLYRPEGSGPWPGVLMYMDGIGIRPAMLEAGERLATHGYVVLLPDLFYRAGPYEPMNAKTVFTDPEQRKLLMEKFFPAASQGKIMSDTRAFLDFLGAQRDVKPDVFGTTGYCMGGRMSLVAAASYPDRIVAAASYHAGRLVTEGDDSPHLLLGKIKARVYICRASEDASFSDENKAAVEAALSKAGVDYKLETSPAKHGWVLTDTPVYDAKEAERHWKTLVELLDSKLKS